eukprot:TRINITY_DN4229_c0_g1_i3.p1 TRINITY_DN4229_c0_g1~~TRINITY_DN4229_c0_g1_i3.p1  ORF type:complete len:293 (+),score=95.03 TRINITY_DN4229_c0_g1_i3:64-942(+)
MAKKGAASKAEKPAKEKKNSEELPAAASKSKVAKSKASKQKIDKPKSKPKPTPTPTPDKPVKADSEKTKTKTAKPMGPLPEDSREHHLDMVMRQIPTVLSKIMSGKDRRSAQNHLNIVFSRIKSRFNSLQVPILAPQQRNYKNIGERSNQLEIATIANLNDTKKMSAELNRQLEDNTNDQQYLESYKNRRVFEAKEQSKAGTHKNMEFDGFLQADLLEEFISNAPHPDFKNDADDDETRKIKMEHEEIMKRLTKSLLNVEENGNAIVGLMERITNVKDAIIDPFVEEMDFFE